MYGPPGTGKTLLARACAAQTEATFLKLAGPQLVQMFIGDGAKLVRDCFALAKEKAPSIIFIDELDAVGTKRFDSDKSGDREVQRTMLELLNQLDGFASDDRIKVLAATNRVDVLDPALLRSGRLDRKIEFPLPNEESRAQILRIHSRKMTVDEGVNWPELARSTDEFGGAMLKAVCVEAGMIALRSGQSKIVHEHYVDAIAEVQSKKKESYVSLLISDYISTPANFMPESQSMPNRFVFCCIGGVGGAFSERHISGFVIIASARHDSSWTLLIRFLVAAPEVVIVISAVLRFAVFGITLKLALLSCDLHLCSTIAQAHFTAFYAGHESHLLPALFVAITDTPDLCDEGVTRLDGTRKSCSKLFDVGWIRVSEQLQESMSCSIPTEQATVSYTHLTLPTNSRV